MSLTDESYHMTNDKIRLRAGVQTSLDEIESKITKKFTAWARGAPEG